MDPRTVQLTDKALPVVVLEEPWQDGVRELNTVVDIEHISLFGPRDEMLNRRIFYHSIAHYEQSNLTKHDAKKTIGEENNRVSKENYEGNWPGCIITR